MDKIRFFFIALLGMGAAHLSAQTADSTQTSPWKTEGFAGLKLTQVSLTNWSAGGDNSVAFDLQGTYLLRLVRMRCRNSALPPDQAEEQGLISDRSGPDSVLRRDGWTARSSRWD